MSCHVGRLLMSRTQYIIIGMRNNFSNKSTSHWVNAASSKYLEEVIYGGFTHPNFSSSVLVRWKYFITLFIAQQRIGVKLDVATLFIIRVKSLQFSLVRENNTHAARAVDFYTHNTYFKSFQLFLRKVNPINTLMLHALWIKSALSHPISGVRSVQSNPGVCSDAPLVTGWHSFTHNKHNITLELVCSVTANPPAKVSQTNNYNIFMSKQNDKACLKYERVRLKRIHS